jgi:hypothetical protein
LGSVNFLQNHDQVGNRAFGERIVALTTPHALRAAVAVLLLAPSPPLLFMGEEWAAPEPFLFFCDLGDDLREAVRDGRRRELGVESWQGTTLILPLLAPAGYSEVQDSSRHRRARSTTNLRKMNPRPPRFGTARGFQFHQMIKRWRLWVGPLFQALRRALRHGSEPHFVHGDKLGGGRRRVQRSSSRFVLPLGGKGPDSLLPRRTRQG